GTYTRLFDNLDPSQRSTLLEKCELGDSELPVFGSLRDSVNWLVLTTERLTWSMQGKRQEVAAKDIRDAIADFKELQRSGHNKLNMQQLRIVTMAAGEYLIELEPGAPLSGSWNVLKNLGARNRSAIEKA
ncbi:MAG: hypothetical protein JO163_13830, partial [Methylobacteriaceae bacterium]|nr:hypothetical protein [Methylobacteriaceae bacterium]